jgi:hypothetical protein
VKQRCPLSPLLFNYCLKSLLQVMKRECERCRVFVGLEEDRVMFTVQTYADDVIFISKTAKVSEKCLDFSNNL